jgi:lactate dehydrogenase-like 2-hydroxyacid dehydrogenase
LSEHRIFVTRQLPGPAVEELRGIGEVRVSPEDRALTRAELRDGVRDADALLCLLTDRVDGEVMDESPRLKVVSNVAVGYDNIDVEAATVRGIFVTNTPRVLTETVADLTWALILGTARRVVEADRFLRAGRWQSWSPTLLAGNDVHRRTLGVVGLGQIGTAVARRAHGFGMQVLYYDVDRKAEAESELGLTYTALDGLLREADYVTVHVPLNPATHHLIGDREIGLMRQSAYLINTSRGPVVDEEALVHALKEGRIAGAGLDVFEHEPLDPSSPLVDLDNVVLLPHIGSATLATRAAMASLAAECIIAVLGGRVPPALVNRELLKTHPLG